MSHFKRRVVAIDGMGGDLAPKSVFQGLARSQNRDFHFLIFGDELRLKQFEYLLPSCISYEIRHCDLIVTPEMDVLSSLKSAKKSSMGMAIQSVQTNEALAVISSGNTGLYMALSKIILKTISDIDRPAIASLIPAKNERQTVFLDLGANAECSVKNLIDFAIMGEAVAGSIFNKKDIKLALLNIGSEKSKGSKLVRSTSEILEKLFPNYSGFIEGDAIHSGDVDVIITDGFTGNVSLKTMEGTAKYIISELKKSLASSFLAKIGATLSYFALSSLKKKFDPRLFNGAVLVGLNGVVVKSHGNSDGVGFANAIKFTTNILRNNIFDRIKEQLHKSKMHCLDFEKKVSQ